jgi:hypothetical protein
MNARTDQKTFGRSPLVRVRHMVIIIGGIAALLIGPLLLVWKQAYIRGSSVRLEAMADTLSFLDREISVLRFKSEKLSSTERIETFARVSLDLEYPSSDRMVVVSIDNKDNRRPRGTKELFAVALDRLPKRGAR